MYCSVSSLHFILATRGHKTKPFQPLIYGFFAPLVLPFKLCFIIPRFFGIEFRVLIVIQPSSDADQVP